MPLLTCFPLLPSCRRTLAPLDAFQIDSLGHAFKATVGKSLLASIEGETSGWFEGALRAKILGPVGYDVWLVHRACNGAGTNEDILNEVLIGRSNAEMWALKQAFRATYNRDMEKVVEDDLSMKTKRMFVMVMQAARQEEWAPVDPGLVQQDVKDLKNAARGAGTDEIKVSSRELLTIEAEDIIDVSLLSVCADLRHPPLSLQQPSASRGPRLQLQAGRSFEHGQV